MYTYTLVNNISLFTSIFGYISLCPKTIVHFWDVKIHSQESRMLYEIHMFALNLSAQLFPD